MSLYTPPSSLLPPTLRAAAEMMGRVRFTKSTTSTAYCMCICTRICSIHPRMCTIPPSPSLSPSLPSLPSSLPLSVSFPPFPPSLPSSLPPSLPLSLFHPSHTFGCLQATGPNCAKVVGNRVENMKEDPRRFRVEGASSLPRARSRKLTVTSRRVVAKWTLSWMTF